MQAQTRLLARDDELATARGLLEEAEAGRGATLAFIGPPGIGKSSLLAATRERADQMGFSVHSATAMELEQELPFGVARQLFEPALVSASQQDRDELLAGAAGFAGSLLGVEPSSSRGEPQRVPDPSFPVMHGLYWLAANLAARGPVLLAVDDAHWADSSSLRWLAYLAARLGGLPLLLAVAAREGERANPHAALVDALTGPSGSRAMHPSPLDEGSVAELVRAELETDPAETFVAAAYTATGGNPFLLRELLAVLAAEGVEPTPEGADRVARLGPVSVTRAVLGRLAVLPTPSTELARAMAILGRTDLRTAANLANLDEATAAEAADALSAAHVLRRARPLEFVHPMVRTVIYEDIAPQERASGHARAARALAGHSADDAEVATHLLATEPQGDSWVVEVLRRAATKASADGAVEVAGHDLRRALIEPPLPEQRAEVLTELGSMEALQAEPDAVEHLREAVELAEDPDRRGQTALHLGRALLFSGRAEEAIQVLDQARADLPPESPLSMRLDAEAFVAGYVDLSARRLVADRARQISEAAAPAGGLPLAAAALEKALTAGPAAEASALATRALDGGHLLAEESADSASFYMAPNTLHYCDELELSGRIYAEAIAEARARGSRRGFAMASCWRAASNYRRGDLHNAEADARNSISTGIGGAVSFALASAFLADVLRAQGEPDAAMAALEESAAAAQIISGSALFHLVLESRGRVKLALGDVESGLEDMLECGRREKAWGFLTPAMTLWRAHAAVALAALDQPDEARRHADQAVEQARAFGSARALGIALRAAGLATDGEERLRLLGQAVTMLERSQARLEHARALVDFGAALRRGREKVKARPPLRAGLAHARACGATALAERAHEELAATGVRSRKMLLSGVEALTASERRIAEMAAAGTSNREIAQKLFVTLKTVETHLTRTYQKLDISSRRELEPALAPRAGVPS